jgi:hypothetical protein
LLYQIDAAALCNPQASKQARDIKSASTVKQKIVEIQSAHLARIFEGAGGAIELERVCLRLSVWLCFEHITDRVLSTPPPRTATTNERETRSVQTLSRLQRARSNAAKVLSGTAHLSI